MKRGPFRTLFHVGPNLDHFRSSSSSLATNKNWPFTLIRELGPILSNPNLFFIFYFIFITFQSFDEKELFIPLLLVTSIPLRFEIPF